MHKGHEAALSGDVETQLACFGIGKCNQPLVPYGVPVFCQ